MWMTVFLVYSLIVTSFSHVVTSVTVTFTVFQRNLLFQALTLKSLSITHLQYLFNLMLSVEWASFSDKEICSMQIHWNKPFFTVLFVFTSNWEKIIVTFKISPIFLNVCHFLNPIFQSFWKEAQIELLLSKSSTWYSFDTLLCNKTLRKRHFDGSAR